MGVPYLAVKIWKGKKIKKDLKKMEKKVDFLDYLWYYNTRLKQRGKTSVKKLKKMKKVVDKAKHL